MASAVVTTGEGGGWAVMGTGKDGTTTDGGPGAGGGAAAAPAVRALSGC